MIVKVKLLSRFRTYLPPQARGEATVALPDSATVAHLLAQLGIDGRVKLITVNGERVADRQRLLRDGDSVRIFPFVVGG
jgi:sulfur carrier protein ThiS